MYVTNARNIKTRVFRRFTEHLRLVHAHELHFSVRCGVDNCEKVYKNLDSYTKYIERFHSKLSLGEGDENRYIQNQMNDELTESNEPFQGQNDSGIAGQNGSEGTSPNIVSIHDTVGLFILMMKEKHNLPETTIDTLLKDFHCLLSRDHVQKKELVRGALHADGVDVDRIDTLLDALDENTVFSALDYFASDTNQRNFMLNKINYFTTSRICGWSI